MTRDRIYAWLLAHGPATQVEIADALGMDKSNVSRYCRALRAAGRLAPADTVPRMREGRAEALPVQRWAAVERAAPPKPVPKGPPSVPLVRQAMQSRPALETAWLRASHN